MLAQDIGRPVVFPQERRWFFKEGWFIHPTEDSRWAIKGLARAREVYEIPG